VVLLWLLFYDQVVCSMNRLDEYLHQIVSDWSGMVAGLLSQLGTRFGNCLCDCNAYFNSFK